VGESWGEAAGDKRGLGQCLRMRCPLGRFIRTRAGPQRVAWQRRVQARQELAVSGSALRASRASDIPVTRLCVVALLRLRLGAGAAGACRGGRQRGQLCRSCGRRGRRGAGGTAAEHRPRRAPVRALPGRPLRLQQGRGRRRVPPLPARSSPARARRAALRRLPGWCAVDGRRRELRGRPMCARTLPKTRAGGRGALRDTLWARTCAPR
jgi:hypothetical protein